MCWLADTRERTHRSPLSNDLGSRPHTLTRWQVKSSEDTRHTRNTGKVRLASARALSLWSGRKESTANASILLAHRMIKSGSPSAGEQDVSSVSLYEYTHTAYTTHVSNRFRVFQTTTPGGEDDPWPEARCACHPERQLLYTKVDRISSVLCGRSLIFFQT